MSTKQTKKTTAVTSSSPPKETATKNTKSTTSQPSKTPKDTSKATKDSKTENKMESKAEGKTKGSTSATSTTSTTGEKKKSEEKYSYTSGLFKRNPFKTVFKKDSEIVSRDYTHFNGKTINIGVESWIMISSILEKYVRMILTDTVASLGKGSNNLKTVTRATLINTMSTRGYDTFINNMKDDGFKSYDKFTQIFHDAKTLDNLLNEIDNEAMFGTAGTSAKNFLCSVIEHIYIRLVFHAVILMMYGKATTMNARTIELALFAMCARDCHVKAVARHCSITLKNAKIAGSNPESITQDEEEEVILSGSHARLKAKVSLEVTEANTHDNSDEGDSEEDGEEQCSDAEEGDEEGAEGDGDDEEENPEEDDQEDIQEPEDTVEEQEATLVKGSKNSKTNTSTQTSKAKSSTTTKNNTKSPKGQPIQNDDDDGDIDDSVKTETKTTNKTKNTGVSKQTTSSSVPKSQVKKNSK